MSCVRVGSSDCTTRVSSHWSPYREKHACPCPSTDSWRHLCHGCLAFVHPHETALEIRVRSLIPAIVLLLCVPVGIRAQVACPTPWRLDEVLRIGSPESADLIMSINDLAVGPDSALYVAQAMVPAIKVFSLDGELLRQIGRAGQGPGDISRAASGVGWIGDTLWIADLGRIQLFTNDDRVPEQVIEFTLPMPGEGTRITPGRLLEDGTLIGGRRSITDWRAWLTAPSLPLRRLSRSGEILDTIAVVDWSSSAVEYEEDPGRQWLSIHPLKDLPDHGLKEYLTTLKPDGSAVVQIGGVNEGRNPATFDMLVISIHGDTLLNQAIEYQPREVTSAMENRLADEFAAVVVGDHISPSLRTPMGETMRERRRRAARRAFWVPEYHPPVRQIVAGTDGTIWLLREMREDRVDVWEIYDSYGTLEGRIEVGDGHRFGKPWGSRLDIVIASRDEVWATTFDEFSVPYIHRYRVDRTCAR